MKKRLVIVVLALAVGFTAAGASAAAMLCDQCGFGDKKTHCFKCGKPFAKVMAMLCDQCGFGDKKKNCVKCGKYTFD